MSDADKLRERASRLFAMALRARDHGLAWADELTDLAGQALVQAEDIERQAAMPPLTPEQPQQVAQQQQQVQPKKE